MLAVENVSRFPLRGVHVSIRSSPSWMVFTTSSVVIDSIPSNAWQDAVFEFRVSEGPNEQAAAVMVSIADGRGYVLATRVINLRSIPPPVETKLNQPYPNPANPSSTIRYTLHAPSHVKIEIFNTLGQRVRRLVDTDEPAGILSRTWDGKNDQGVVVASGMYIVRLKTTEQGTKLAKQFPSKLLIQK